MVNSKFVKNEIKELKIFFLISFLIILISTIIPFFFEINLNLPIETLNKIAQNLSDKNVFYIIGFIFLNNLRTSFFLMFFGIIFFIPIFINVLNGLVIGTVLKKLLDSGESYFIILKLLPHGIFELPAIFIATALGLRIGFNLFNNNYPKKKLFRNSIYSFIFLTILLFIGAIIEGISIYFF